MWSVEGQVCRGPSQGSRKDVFREYLGPWNVSKYYFYREYCKTLVLTWILWSPNSKAKNRPRWEQHLKRLTFLKNLHSMYLASQCPQCPITRLGSIETSNRFCVYWALPFIGPQVSWPLEPVVNTIVPSYSVHRQLWAPCDFIDVALVKKLLWFLLMGSLEPSLFQTHF